MSAGRSISTSGPELPTHLVSKERLLCHSNEQAYFHYSRQTLQVLQQGLGIRHQVCTTEPECQQAVRAQGQQLSGATVHGPCEKVASTTRLPLSVTTGPALAAPPMRNVEEVWPGLVGATLMHVSARLSAFLQTGSSAYSRSSAAKTWPAANGTTSIGTPRVHNCLKSAGVISLIMFGGRKSARQP